jgi:hypothetical protein
VKEKGEEKRKEERKKILVVNMAQLPFVSPQPKEKQ